MKEVYVDWQQVEQSCDLIASKFATHVDVVVGITRGGLVPAVMLSHRMMIPMMTCNITTRDGDCVEIDDKIIELSNTDRRILVVDDINDTGLTAEIVRDTLPNCVIATLTHKPNTRMIPNQVGIFSTFESQQNAWVVFPWEM